MCVVMDSPRVAVREKAEAQDWGRVWKFNSGKCPGLNGPVIFPFQAGRAMQAVELVSSTRKGDRRSTNSVLVTCWCWRSGTGSLAA
jgi:hypothetical protein